MERVNLNGARECDHRANRDNHPGAKCDDRSKAERHSHAKRQRRDREPLIIKTLSLLILFAVSAIAEPVPAPKVEVRHADSVEYDGGAKTIQMTGAVHVVRGTMSIKADRVDIEMMPDEKGVKKAIATGRVEIIDGERKARSARAEFMEQAGEIILTGAPKLWSGGNEIEAERIIYSLETRSMRAAGKVRGLFLPGAAF